nr:uncharacterized protein CTRU02_08544 [Colletotrichum truncatum]KAF6789845.1 hypothetical protein CTRU02_08544 [Colletotrichum truncatum]
MASLQPSTWRLLGLSVAASYTALGAIDCLIPHRAAEEFFGIEPYGSTTAVSILMPLLGARDISIAAALFALARQHRGREMGTVILAGTILCVADVVVLWRRKGPRRGGAVAAGVTIWTAIGLGLLWS